MEEEIDLSKYLAVLLRRWWVVIGVALVCVLIAATATYLQPKKYIAHGRIAVVETNWQVSFDTAIKSPIKDEGALAADLQQRQTTFATLISNPATAEAVLDKLGDRLPPADRNLKALLTMVKGTAIKGSNLIDIAATASDPDVAVLVVNAWAEEYVRQADSLAGDPEEGALTLVHDQAQSAKATYEKAQAALEEALARDRSGELKRLIAEHEATIRALRNARDSIVLTLLYEIRRLERLYGDALAMRAQVQAGGQGAVESNGPALVLLKAQVFANTWNEAPQWGTTPSQPQAQAMGQVETASTSGLQPSAQAAPITLQVQAAPPALQVQHTPLTMTAEAMVSDLDALAATLERRQSALKEELRGISESLAKGEESAFFISTQSTGGDQQGESADVSAQLMTTLRTLEQHVRELRAQLSKEMSRLQEVQAQRDLAWQSYDNLARKEAELAVAAQIAGDQVRFAAPAAVALQSAGSTKSVALVAMVGLLAGAVAAYALEAWLNRRARARARDTAN